MEQQMSKQKLKKSHCQTTEDEIDLVQLFQILWKHKTMIIAITSLLTIAAIGVSFMMPKVYKVTAILEPGRDAEGKVFVSSQAIRENILGGAYDEQVAKQLGLPLSDLSDIKVSVPNETDLVKISIESSKPHQAVQILRELLDDVTSDMQERLDIEIKKTKNSIKNAQIEDNFLLTKSHLIREQIAQIQLKMTDLERQRKKALASPKDNAMAVLLYSNEIQDQQVYLNSLQGKMAEVLNKKNKMAAKIDNIKLSLAGIKGSNINKEPSIPNKPIKPKKLLIVVSVFILALIGSVMLVFFSELISMVRQKEQVE